MNRHARNRLAGLPVILAWAVLWSATGRAQQDGRTAQLIKMYSDCVFDAVRSQLQNASVKIEPSATTELAFQSCRTEEQAILAQGATGGVTTTQANQAIIGLKLSLKQRVRKVFADAEKRAPRPTAQQSAPAALNNPPPTRYNCSSSYLRYDGATVYTNCK